MLDHDQSRKLAALAAIGQITSEEETELEAHLERCPECKQVQSDYRLIISRLALHSLAGSERENPTNTVSQDKHLRESFLARARAEGVQFSLDSELAIALSEKQTG